MLEQFISDKLKEVAERLPTMVHSEPASFSCGYNVGYKQCCLDLLSELEKEETNDFCIDDRL